MYATNTQKLNFVSPNNWSERCHKICLDNFGFNLEINCLYIIYFQKIFSWKVLLLFWKVKLSAACPKLNRDSLNHSLCSLSILDTYIYIYIWTLSLHFPTTKLAYWWAQVPFALSPFYFDSKKIFIVI